RSTAAAVSSSWKTLPSTGATPRGQTKEKNSMAEIERVRERERPPLKDNPYERVMAQSKAIAERNLTGLVVIDVTQQDWFQARQGKLKFFLDPVSLKNSPLQQGRVVHH